MKASIAPYLILHRFAWAKVFILWKLHLPIFSFCTGSFWPMFHFAKLPFPLLAFCTGSPELSFHFMKASLSLSFILHRFACAKVSFYESFPFPFSHSAQFRLSQRFILWKLPLPLLSFCPGSSGLKFHFMKASLSPFFHSAQVRLS